MRTFLIVVLLCCGIYRTSAQTDSIQQEPVTNKKQVYSSARKATIMSAVLPGLGQIYNKKIWKTGIIYGAFGGLGYLFYVNQSNYSDFRKALILSQEPQQNGFASGYSTSQLSIEKARYKKYRDFTVIGLAAVYLLNIVDANVDAHLKTFDVSDDLSLNIDLWQLPHHPMTGRGSATGLSLKLNFN